ncbi:M14 family zinc carboxypeptidase [Neobacillus terrae]|uniref:M14 family zinc carboxypeptidase n=1 Tax=Neobacillus terrae TaxID=3034837 RepID=UPI00140BDB2D|nr:M14 family zinc carboxypeptidase [Neobacillus terrae]NHM30024.1 peptidase M14 [Neobacillus terrae]
MKLKSFIIFIVCILLTSLLPFKTKAAGPIVNPNKVYSYVQMVSDIQNLQKAYPDFIRVKVIGKSEYGRSIYAVGLGNGNTNLFINGSHHAREWMTTTLNMYMIENYASAYRSNTKISGYSARSILDLSTIWFVPMVNPDGVILQQQGLNAFPKNVQASLIKMNGGSKNFNSWKANGKGIDLNRQYNALWKNIKNSPKGPSLKNFKGYAPETAAETKAIVKFVNEINPEMAISYHSSGHILYWNFLQDSARYKRDLVYAKTINKMTGYSLVNPGKNPSGGGFTDWFIYTKKKPAFTPEIGRYVIETSLPLTEFNGVWRENQAVGLYAAQESIKLLEARMAKSVQDLSKKLNTLVQSANQLKVYYNDNIKDSSSLAANQKFMDLYNQVNRNYQSLSPLVGKMPTRYQAGMLNQLKVVQAQLTNAHNFIDIVKQGDQILALNSSLHNILNAGTINSTAVNQYNQLVLSKTKVEAAIKKMYGTSVQNIALKKYIIPVTITIENNRLEIERYQLSLLIDTSIQQKNIDLAKQQLLQLDQLEKDSAAIKVKGNLQYPGQYPVYPLIEKYLSDYKNTLMERLAALENLGEDQ